MVKALLVFATIFTALLASGCSVTPETPEARDRRIANEQANIAAYWARVRDLCNKYGYREGTNSFAQCMQTESIALRKRQQQEADAAREAQQAVHEHWKRLSCSMGNTWDCTRTTTCRQNVGGTVTCYSSE